MPARLPSNSRHLVQPGDTLGAIAIRYNVPIGELRKLNGIRGHSIRAGKTLLIPDTRLATNAGTQKNTQHDHRHIVKPGDSFWTLGRRYAISARTLARHNGHALNSTLYPGQLLLIPKVSGGSTAEQTAAAQVRLGLNLIRLYAVLSAPFIPSTAARMMEAMQTSDDTWPSDVAEALSHLTAGHEFSVPDVLFAKITDEQREEWQDRFAGTRD